MWKLHDSGMTAEWRRTAAPWVVAAGGLLAALSTGNAGAALLINEVVSSNGGSYRDETGATPDWIELRNTGPDAVALEGYGLSDAVNSPFKWTFPRRSLAAGGYLVVCASGQDRRAGSLPHTNFSLSRQGETVTLTAPGGETVDTVPAVELRRDMSLGRSSPDGAWRFFPAPTPGRVNAGASFAGVVKEGPAFSVAGGFFDGPVSLTLTSPDAQAVVRYTLDGSEPVETSPQWTAPLVLASRQGEPDVLPLIQGTATVNEHTDGWKAPKEPGRKAWAVRARAFREDMVPSPVVSHTYCIGPEAKRTDGLAVISLMSDRAGLFDYRTGIYMLGKVFDDYVAAHPGERLTGHTPANYTQRGAAWKRECSVEFFEPGATGRAWAAPAWLDIKGQSSRSFRQKSFGLDFQSTEPPEGAVGYDLFPGLVKMGDGTPLRVFQHLRLRNFGNDWAYAAMRDGFCQRLVAGLGLDTTAWRPVSVYLNGEYWGMLEMREEQDTAYFAAHYGVDPDDVVILNGDGSAEEGRASDTQDFVALRTYAETHDLSLPEHLAWVEARMDLRNFLRWQAAEIYLGNADWPQNNVRLWRMRRTGGPVDPATVPHGHDGRWRWMLFDLDLAAAHPWAGGHSENTLSFALSETGRSGIRNPQATSLLRALLKNPAVKAAFATEAADLLNSHGKASRATAMADAVKAQLEPGMAEHIKRWRSQTDPAAWSSQVRTVRTWASQRELYVRQHFTATLGLGGYAPLTVDRSPAGGGEVQVNRLKINGALPGVTAAVYPWTGTYFRQVPVTLTALPGAGMEFEKWITPSGESSSPSLSLLPAGPTAVTARFRPMTPRWERVERLADGSVPVVMAGLPGTVYRLQFSTDLTHWTGVDTFTTDAAGRWTHILPPPRTGQPAGYYRAVHTP